MDLFWNEQKNHFHLGFSEKNERISFGLKGFNEPQSYTTHQQHQSKLTIFPSNPTPKPEIKIQTKTNLSHIVFGIGASSKLWN